LTMTSYGVGACYDILTGEKYWEAEFNDAIYGSPVLVGDNVYQMTNSGKLWVFKMAKSFQKVAESDLGEQSVCTPAIIEGKMFLRGYENLYCIGN
jgi:outer membrane protein assembly factor BamB